MRRLFVWLLAAALLAAWPALAEENLLQNGDFEQVHDGWPVSWEEDMWLYDVGVTYLELREGGADGGLCALVENVSSNDARFVQTVEVQPDTVYRLTGFVKAEGIDPETGAGASLSVIGSYGMFPSVYDTGGEWTELTSYFKTHANQRSLIVGARLGDYSADNSGKAWFDGLSLTRVDEAPAGVSVISLRDYTDSAVSQGDQAADAKASEGADSQVLWLSLFAAALCLLYIARGRGVPSPRLALFLLLLLSALLRLYLMATRPGYETDMSCFFAWSMRMAQVGPNAFYAPDYFCDYPPGYLYLLWATGGLLRLLGVTELGEAGRAIVKLMPMLADLGAILLLWKLSKKRLGEAGALCLSALYAISPAVLVDGAVWGQVDAVVALGLLITVALAVEGRWRFALPAFTVTVLMKPQALIAGPIGLVALALSLIGKEGKKTAIEAARGLLASLLTAAVLLLPFLWGKPDPIGWVIGQYAATLGSYEYATVNAANLYYLLGANWVPLSARLGPFTYGAFGTVMTVLSVLFAVWLYVRRRDVRELPFYCALIYLLVFLLGAKMHERYLFPALLLLLLAYVRRRDWRLLLLFAGFSATFYVNCATVLRDTHLAVGHGFLGSVLSAANLLLTGVAVWTALDPRTLPLPMPVKPERKSRLAALTTETEKLPRMRQKDWLLMLALTGVYACVAFIGLGSTKAPQTVWTSTGMSEEVVFDLGERQEFHVLYYAGINWRDHTFVVEFSDDGADWIDPSAASLKRGDCFRWQYLTQAVYDAAGAPSSWTDDPLICGARYVRLTTDGPAASLMEVAFRNLNGVVLPVRTVKSAGEREGSGYDPRALVDEPDTVPEYPSYLSGTYFDEIYHARTGYEHANGLQTYETTHPPLGKIFIMLGIQIFGMTPFGWRFMGALSGVLMVPAMYLLGKLLFKKARYALLAAFVMAFDLMHLTQTRIATIDSYAVLFILLMYLCMFRYLQMNFFRDRWRTLIPLLLSGLFMGLGCASKWIGIYAGAGLAVLFFWSMAQRFLEWREATEAGGEMAERVRDYPRLLVGTLGACVGFFIVIPALIYYFSYIPYFAWEGGLTLDKFMRAQEGMFSYHATLVDDHAFKSPWYEWPLILKPMYYYNGKPFIPADKASTIMCMGNPAVWWVGLGTLLYAAWQWLRPHLTGRGERDSRLSMLLLSFLAQFLPWVLVPRSTFIYHYFGSLPFVMLTIVYAFERLHEARPKAARVAQGAYMGAVALLFAAFYPFATGALMSYDWAGAMNWFGFLYLPGWKYRGWLYY